MPVTMTIPLVTPSHVPASRDALLTLRAYHALAPWSLRDLATLSAMDDMMLKDIGVNRCQIRGAIDCGTDLKPLR